MKFCFRSFWTILLIVSSSFSAVINADTFTTTTHAFIYDDPYVGHDLEQFHPTLGKLTGVRFHVNYNYDVNYSFETYIADSRLPHLVDLSMSFRAGLTIPSASDETLHQIASIFVSGSDSCNGDPTPDPQACTEGSFEIRLGSTNHPVTNDVYQRLVNDNLLEMFIGEGHLTGTGLELYYDLPASTHQTIISNSINIKPEYHTVHIWDDLEATVSIIYTYTPHSTTRPPIKSSR
jgi:hypothetical protein